MKANQNWIQNSFRIDGLRKKGSLPPSRGGYRIKGPTVEIKEDYKNFFYEKYGRKRWSSQQGSQNGEDGVIDEIFRRLGIRSGHVCEFGAWDGKRYCNTLALVERGFKAVYIECSRKKYNDLLNTVKEYPNITPIYACVDSEDTPNSLDNAQGKLVGLDNLLKGTDLPVDFDLLSMDVDGEDYNIWTKQLKNHKPKVVIIEINTWVSPYDENWIHGKHDPASGLKCKNTGFLPMYNLGKEKGYTLVCHTGNMIFVRDELFDKLDVEYDHPVENFITYYQQCKGTTKVGHATDPTGKF